LLASFAAEGEAEVAMEKRNDNKTMKKQVPVCAHMRWLIGRDLPEVLQTDLESFENSWTEEEFRHARRRPNCIGMVAEVGDAVAGYLIYERHKRKLVLKRIAVHPRFRRRGVGTQMLAKLVSKLSARLRTRVSIDVPERLDGAHLWLRACGWEAVMVNHEQGEDDTYRFAYRLPVEAEVAHAQNA
jgi:ribosomal-protein-alanine N-acetyltransferase